jgi:hypothetical protein
VIVAISTTGALELTAFATLVLAVVTAASLLFGWKSLSLSRTALEETHRPAVVPVADRRRIELPGRPERQAAPKLVDGALLVPVENLGAGAALTVEASVSWVDKQLPPPSMRKPLAGLSTGVIMPLWLYGPGWTAVSDFELTLTYVDVSGRQWRTRGHWNAEHDLYEDVTVQKMRR